MDGILYVTAWITEFPYMAGSPFLHSQYKCPYTTSVIINQWYSPGRSGTESATTIQLYNLYMFAFCIS